MKPSLPAVTFAILGALAVVVGGGCGRDPSTIPAGDGRALFQAMCATCHGPDGRPPAAMAARIGVRDLSAGEFRARATPALIERQVRAGSKSRLMPSFQGVLDDAQITAIAAFVASPQFVRPGQPGAPR